MSKRCALDKLENTPTKLLKTDTNHLMSKVRTALFQDKNCESKLKNVTLSTKNFYNYSETKIYKISPEIPKEKRQEYHIRRVPYHRKYIKRHSIGGINAGVSHGIKKPKPKTNLISTKCNNNIEMINDISNNVQKNLSQKIKIPESEIVTNTSPEIDLNKRFFKIKKSSKKSSSAIVTISNNVKLKIESNGKMILNQKNENQSHKRQKLVDISFDATDLSVDEPETTIEKDKVANILKILENDWADDDYDTMEVLTNERLERVSPLKSVLNNVTMSPASELSNMTSTISIKDISIPTVLKNIPLDNNENTSEQKYYPLFNKGYSANKEFK